MRLWPQYSTVVSYWSRRSYSAQSGTLVARSCQLKAPRTTKVNHYPSPDPCRAIMTSMDKLSKSGQQDDLVVIRAMGGHMKLQSSIRCLVKIHSNILYSLWWFRWSIRNRPYDLPRQKSSDSSKIEQVNTDPGNSPNLYRAIVTSMDKLWKIGQHVDLVVIRSMGGLVWSYRNIRVVKDLLKSTVVLSMHPIRIEEIIY